MDAVLHYTAPRRGYLPGEVIERDVQAIDGAPLGRVWFTIGTSPGSGYAGQVYHTATQQPGFLPPQVALKVLRPRSRWKNFDSPYHAQSITEFWRRWHISLSTWLRDYLYLPLGGNRLGARRTYLNLAVVMLLGGLWHGASWNFAIWGAMHGGLLAYERACGKRPSSPGCCGRRSCAPRLRSSLVAQG